MRRRTSSPLYGSRVARLGVNTHSRALSPRNSDGHDNRRAASHEAAGCCGHGIHSLEGSASRVAMPRRDMCRVPCSLDGGGSGAQ